MPIDIGRDIETYSAALTTAIRCGWVKAKVGDKTPPSRRQVQIAMNDRFGIYMCSENLTRSLVNAARCAFFERKNVWPKKNA